MQFINQNVKILRRITSLYSPTLKNVGWIKDAQLIFLIFYTFVCKFGSLEGAARETKYRQMHGKLEKLTERLLSKLHSSKLGCGPKV